MCVCGLSSVGVFVCVVCEFGPGGGLWRGLGVVGKKAGLGGAWRGFFKFLFLVCFFVGILVKFVCERIIKLDSDYYWGRRGFWVWIC